MKNIVILLVVVLVTRTRAKSVPTEEDPLHLDLKDVGLLINGSDFLLNDIGSRVGKVGDISCSTGQEYWKHPTDCHKYVRCIWGRPEEMDCAPGSVWVHSNSPCGDLEINTVCDNGGLPKTTLPTVPPTQPTTAPPTTSSTICENKQSESNCQRWADAGYCTTGKYVSVMETICMKTCNKCSHTCQCGLTNTERIIGGVEVSPNQKYPWIVGLQRPSSNHISCGGSIINDRWILTAAHCIVGGLTCQVIYGPASPLNVVVGEHHRVHTSDDDANTKKYKVKSYFPHEDYKCKPRLFRYDFALLELTERISFNHVIRPICLPTDDSDDYVGRDGIAIGWGRTSNVGPISDYLQEVQLPIFANDNCGNWPTRPSEQLCAGGEPGKATCNGDSGSPLAVVEGNRYIQVGIVSYGRKNKCATTDFPIIFARVSKVLPWITTTTTNGKSCG